MKNHYNNRVSGEKIVEKIREFSLQQKYQGKISDELKNFGKSGKTREKSGILKLCVLTSYCIFLFSVFYGKNKKR